MTTFARAVWPAAQPAGRTRTFIAGLDVLATSERAAEHQLAQLVSCLHRAGAERVTAATHRVKVFSTAHVALSISALGDLGAGRILALLADQLAAEDGAPGAVWTDGIGVGLPALQRTAEQAAAAHRDRTSGRVVCFPGSELLTGTVRVTALLGAGIDRVQALGSDQPEAKSLLMTRDFLRPRWQAGELVLHVQPAAGGTWVPFETPHPTPCCATHA